MTSAYRPRPSSLWTEGRFATTFFRAVPRGKLHGSEKAPRNILWLSAHARKGSDTVSCRLRSSGVVIGCSVRATPGQPRARDRLCGRVRSFPPTQAARISGPVDYPLIGRWKRAAGHFASAIWWRSFGQRPARDRSRTSRSNALMGPLAAPLPVPGISSIKYESVIVPLLLMRGACAIGATVIGTPLGKGHLI